MYATLLKRSAVGRVRKGKEVSVLYNSYYILYIDFFGRFIFYSKYPVLFSLITVAIVRVGGNKVGSAFVKPRDEYMY